MLRARRFDNDKVNHVQKVDKRLKNAMKTSQTRSESDKVNQVHWQKANKRKKQE